MTPEGASHMYTATGSNSIRRRVRNEPEPSKSRRNSTVETPVCLSLVCSGLFNMTDCSVHSRFGCGLSFILYPYHSHLLDAEQFKLVVRGPTTFPNVSQQISESRRRYQ